MAALPFLLGGYPAGHSSWLLRSFSMESYSWISRWVLLATGAKADSSSQRNRSGLEVVEVSAVDTSDKTFFILLFFTIFGNRIYRASCVWHGDTYAGREDNVTHAKESCKGMVTLYGVYNRLTGGTAVVISHALVPSGPAISRAPVPRDDHTGRATHGSLKPKG